MGSTNFLQWNPSQSNQESDTAYAADPQRSGGAADDSAFPSPTANKLFYQTSTGIAALMQMMATKGYVVSDANFSTLASVLSALLTTHDIRPGITLLSYASTIACNVSQALGFEIPLNGSPTLTVSGAQTGDEVTFVFFQDSTGGHTVSWPSNFFGALQPDPTPSYNSSQVFKVETNGNFVAITPMVGINTTGLVNTPIGIAAPSSGAFTALTANTPSSSDNSVNVATTAWAKLGFTFSFGSAWYIKFPTWLGGLIIQGGVTGTLSDDGIDTISFTTNFSTMCMHVDGVDINHMGGNVRTIGAAAISTSQFQITATGSDAIVNWIAFGY